jgi:putative hemolysin
MQNVAVEIIIIFVLILANGVFAMSEIAIVSARRARLQQRVEDGDRGARTALQLADRPNRFLSTTQIGISLIGVLAGAFGGTTLAGEFAAVVDRVPALAPYGETIGVTVVVLTITYFSLVIGELAPKRYALSHAETIASRIAPLMSTLSRIAAPIVALLSFSTNLVLRVFAPRLPQEAPVTADEIRVMMQEGTEVGVFEPAEEEMVVHVFRLADRTVEQLMTPRSEVIWLDLADPPEETRQRIATGAHSRFPVVRDHLDNVIGLVDSKDLLAQALAGRELDLESAVRPALFIPENAPVLNLLERFRETKSHVALVIDEYGGFNGLVTANDILDAIVGDLPLPEEAAQPRAVQREDGSWLLDGLLPVDELQDILDLDQLPGRDRRLYRTLGGLVLTSLGRIPSAGDWFVWEKWRFEVVDMDGFRVDTVLASPAKPANDTP